MEIDPAFFDSFMQIILEIFFVATAAIYDYWIQPFVIRKKSVHTAALAYWLVGLAGRYTDGHGWALAALSVFVPVLVLYFMDERRNPLQKIFLCIVFSLIWWVVLETLSEIGFYERDFVFRFDFFRSSVAAIIIEFVAWNIFYYSGAGILLCLSFRLLHQTYQCKYEELSWREFVMLLAPASTLLVVKPIVRSYFELWMEGIKNGSIQENIPGDIFRIGFCILSYVSIIVIIVFYQQMKDAQEEQHARYVLDSQTEELKQHIGQIREMYEQMRAMRHDMGNHMSIIEGLVENGEKREASQYIEEWKGQFKEMAPGIKTGNAILDVALSEYAGRFEKAGIVFECNFIYPAALCINEFDLCVAVTNALQNAYEASQKIEEPAVFVKSATRGTALMINIKNRIGKRVQIDSNTELPISNKKEDGHGYGVKNIRHIARKYNGDIEIRQEQDEHRGLWFVINIMLIG